MLAAAGYRCVCSTDGVLRLECLRKRTPDLILSDINLAGHSGVTLCERLKQTAGMAEVPVMFFPALKYPDIIRRSHSAGGTYYLRKPCDPDVLLELIGKALGTPRWLSRDARRELGLDGDPSIGHVRNVSALLGCDDSFANRDARQFGRFVDVSFFMIRDLWLSTVLGERLIRMATCLTVRPRANAAAIRTPWPWPMKSA